jgi:hypothetical protein
LKKYLQPVVLSEYIETLCAEKGLPDTVKQALLAQIQKLKEIYGESIPKDDFLTLTAQQISALQTGYKKQPVDILEFLLSTEYMNLEGTIRPKIKNALIDIFGPYNHCYEIVLSGCVDLDSYIMENNGNLRKLGENIGKFNEVSVCSTSNSYGISDGGRESGIKDVYELVLNNGRAIKLTPDHKIEIVRKGEFLWEELKNVQKTDLVRCVRNWKVAPDMNLGVDMAFLLGCWASDGYARSTDARIATSNIDYLCCLKEVLKRLGFDSYFKEIPNNKATMLHVRNYKKSGFYDLILKYKLLSPKAHTVKIPEEILRSDDNTVISFIRAVWASNGGIHFLNKKHAPIIKLGMVSKDFIRQMQLLLLRFGIQSHYSINPINEKSKRKSITYIISIQGAENQLKFCNLLKFIPGRIDRLEKIVEFQSSKTLNSNVDLVPIPYNKLRQILKDNKIKRPRGSKWVNLSAHCCMRTYPTFKTYNSFVEDFSYLPEVQQLQETFDPNSIYMGIRSIEKCKIEIPTGDIGVKNYYKFIANGISVHNSTRWGKTYLSCCGFAYHIYKLSCLYNPQTHYNLSPGSEIVFTMQSLKEEKAKRNFGEFRGLIDESEYFKKHFPRQGRAKNYAQFNHNITVKPISSTNNAAMSENVYAAFIDEANFMQVIKGSTHQAMDEQYYDQATALYQVIKDRIQNQFKNIATGEWPGKLYLASSANHHEDFIQNKIKEAKKLKHIYVAEYALWEVKDTDKYSGKKFWIQMPTEKEGGFIYDKKPKIMTDEILEIPIELKDQFEADLHGAIRNVAGKPISRESKFIPYHILVENIQRFNQYYQMNQIFTMQEVVLDDVISLSSLLNIPFIKAINPYFTFHSHCDLAVTHDSVGIGVGAAIGCKVTKKKEIIDIDTKEKTEEVEASAPVYAIFGILKIKPPKTGQIDISRVEKFYLTLKEYLTNLSSFSADRAYSITLIKNLRKNGVRTDYVSVDKTPDAYIEKKNCLMEGRLWLPEHEAHKNELKGLMFDVEKNKVDHSKLTEKDVSDAVAGTLYKLSKRQATYKLTNKPVTLSEMKKISGDDAKPGRPNLGERPRSMNRPKRWRKN